MSRKLSMAILFLAILVGGTSAIMSHSNHEEQVSHQKERAHHNEKEGHDHSKMESNQDFSIHKSVMTINLSMEQIDTALKSEKLNDIHDLTETIGIQIKLIESNTKKASNQSTIKTSSSRISGLLMRLHGYADNDDISNSKKQFEKLKVTKDYLYSLLNLPKESPKTMQMTSSSKNKERDHKAGWHKDHDPKHGGQLFMSPNNYNHLEGVLVSMKEFRVYNYDDYTQLIDASNIKGSITVKYKTWYSAKAY